MLVHVASFGDEQFLSICSCIGALLLHWQHFGLGIGSIMTLGRAPRGKYVLPAGRYWHAGWCVRHSLAMNSSLGFAAAPPG